MSLLKRLTSLFLAAVMGFVVGSVYNHFPNLYFVLSALAICWFVVSPLSNWIAEKLWS